MICRPALLALLLFGSLVLASCGAIGRAPEVAVPDFDRTLPSRAGVAWIAVPVPHWPGEAGGGEESPSPSTEVDHGLEWWPLAHARRDPRTGRLRQQWLGPLVETAGVSDPRDEVTVRPLYSYMRDPVRMTEESIALWPVFQNAASYRDYGEPDDRVRNRRLWLLPFFYHNRFSPVPGEWETDWYAPFPFVVGGDSTRDGAHFALVPFGGTVKGLFGADEINFVGGPLYVEVREGEGKTWHFPFPFARYGQGPRYTSHALLPLWAYSRQDSDYERFSFLWPLISFGTDQQSTRWPRRYWQVLPLAARHWTDQSSLVSVLPPFFNYERIEPTDTTIIDVPWPFLRFASGLRYEEFRIWPLYFQSRVNDDWTTSVAWPFFWQFDETDPEWREQRVWLLPFFWNRHRVFTDAGAKRRLSADQLAAVGGTARDGSWQLWPLVRHEYSADGSWRTRMLGLLPPLGERFDRLYGELPAIFKASESEHSTEVSLLWGGFGHWHWKLPNDDGAVTGLIEQSDTRIWPFWSEMSGTDRRVVVDQAGTASRVEVPVADSSFLFGLSGSKSEGADDNRVSRAKFLWLFEYDLD